jgi:hypothetical protein
VPVVVAADEGAAMQCDEAGGSPPTERPSRAAAAEADCAHLAAEKKKGAVIEPQ